MKRQLLLELSSSSLHEFQEAVKTIAKVIPAKAVIALSGSMGAGKTEFVKIFCAGLGIKNVSSPTFALHQRYQRDSLSVDHLDLFRIENADEIESTGFWDFFSQETGQIFIEWSEKMDLGQIPQNWDLFFIEIQAPEAQSRVLRFFKR